jgi:hypothetical protein
LASAKKNADLIKDATLRGFAQKDLVEAQANSGDIAGAQDTLASAQKTAKLIQDPQYKRLAADDLISAQAAIAKAQIKAGEFAGALKIVASIDDYRLRRNDTYSAIAEGQAKAGDIAGAQKTADLISTEFSRRLAHRAIAKIQAEGGVAGAPNPPRQSMPDTQPSIQPVVTVSDWLKKLDDDADSHDCPLNTEPFLDLAGYLKSKTSSDNPEEVFGRLHYTAKGVVMAQNVVYQLLKQQVRK